MNTNNIQLDSVNHDTKKWEEMLSVMIRNYPLNAIDQLLKTIWEMTKSEDPQEQEIGWELLHEIHHFSDGMKCHFLARFCWFKCRDEPITFYLRYVAGDKRALKYYEAASIYDIWTFREDRISVKEFMSVLEGVRHEIEEYNKTAKNRDDRYLSILGNCIIKAKERMGGLGSGLKTRR